MEALALHTKAGLSQRLAYTARQHNLE